MSDSYTSIIIGQNIQDASFADSLPEPWQDKVIGHTNIGRGRQKNQDAASFYFSGSDDEHLILSVADGLGSSPNSEQAAHFAVTQAPQSLLGGDTYVTSFEGIHRKLAEQQMHALQSAPYGNKIAQLGTMGTTTLVLADVKKDRVAIANVGDSRGYLFRDRKIVYCTKDQSAIHLLLETGKIGPGDVRRHPLRNVILNAIGSPEPTYRFSEGGQAVIKPSGLPSVDEIEIRSGDYLLLASDGFFTNLTDDEMLDLVFENEWHTLEDKIVTAMHGILNAGKTSLAELANPDNFTFVVYRHP